MDTHPVRLLLVDDDRTFHSIIRSLLAISRTPFELRCATTFQEGVEAIEEQDFDLCLIDYGLKEHTGVELIRRIRDLGFSAPLIMLTGHVGREVDIEAMNAGATDYLYKGKLDGMTLERSIRYAVERYRSNEALRRSEESLRSVLASAPVLIFSIDSSRVINLTDGRGLLSLNLTPGDFVGHTVTETFSEPRMIQNIERALAGERFVDIMQLRGVIFETHYSPRLDASGRVIGMVGVATDITDRMRHERALQQAHDKLEARVRERTAEIERMMKRLEESSLVQKRFIADASHDLRTPLTVVRAELDLLLEGDDEQNPRIRESLRRIASEATRLEHLASDLLMLATLDAGESPPTRECCRLDELILLSASQLGTLAAERRISWRINCEEPIEVRCDERAMKRALMNILENAIKYSRMDSVVDIALRLDNSHAHVIVEDKGEGIEPRDLPKVFERFYRGDHTRTTPGTGLGLAIVKAVVEAHSGTIDLESEVGVGTRVTLSLPC
jgi:signal transduction histidine kinase